MKITIEAKEVNVNIHDDNGDQVFGYSTSDWSMLLNVKLLLTMVKDLVVQFIALDKSVKAELGDEPTIKGVRPMPKIGETYFIVDYGNGVGTQTWGGSSSEMQWWSEGNCTMNFNEAVEMLKVSLRS